MKYYCTICKREITSAEQDFSLKKYGKPLCRSHQKTINNSISKKEGRYKEGIDFIHQFKFMDKFMCDFCFPLQKVIVEAYGDFWHRNPKKYPKGFKLHPHQKKDIAKDKAKEAYIRKVDKGSWKLIILWESDIKKDVSKCVDKIESYIKFK